MVQQARKCHGALDIFARWPPQVLGAAHPMLKNTFPDCVDVKNYIFPAKPGSVSQILQMLNSGSVSQVIFCIYTILDFFLYFNTKGIKRFLKHSTDLRRCFVELLFFMFFWGGLESRTETNGKRMSGNLPMRFSWAPARLHIAGEDNFLW